ncbi:hypothetical protein DIZ27_32795 [Streptomyces sp. NWU339]|uniref:phage minor head protein n=1 Tax=Streptomyces sp. NWU339 TaxID=2185284 RepID=UPI000D673E92|nr:phage minor head protein [Streptomyces sp. NWU339]PWI06521.1 hypothetical protein DIZ27_32795 [Streptomyces sp. NWU339]
MDEETEQRLADSEHAVAGEVRAVLDELAAELAAELADATEIVAARFSLGRIATAWRERVPRIMRRLFRVAETAAEQAATDADSSLPDGWDDLPARYDDDRLPRPLGDYAEETEHLLRAVGDRLTEAAVAALAEGLNAGEDTEQLRSRLRALLAADGTQLGATREERIARTESSRVWNAATLAAAQAMSSPDRPLVKQWLTRRDPKVRDAHAAVNGQLRLLDEPFTVAGVAMTAPGDPAAPPSLTVNCRCVLRLQAADRSASVRSQDDPGPDAYESKLPPSGVVTAADDEHRRGGMIALLPTAEDAERLALEGGEPADELHCTLVFLGDQGADWTPEQRAELVSLVRDAARNLTGPIRARAFGVNHWNPSSDKPAWVWAVGDDTEHDGPALHDAAVLAYQALEDTHERPEIPAQHSPWVAHVTATYDTDTWPLEPMSERVGPITFDCVRLAFGGEHFDIPLGPEEATDMDTTAAADYALPVRAWSTPGDTALAYENTQTGDGRIFAAGSLYWESTGPWPLQYADEMGMGHDGAELAGAIQDMNRDGDRLAGAGVLYLTQRAGWEAVDLLDQGAPLGVSVDLDDVSVELVDNTMSEDGGLVLAAGAYARASVLALGDGAWMITASSAPEWTASGAAMQRAMRTASVISGPGGRIPADVARALFPDAKLTAAAGDPDDPDTGVVVHAENSGDFLVRVTRARVRGATLVAMPAYDQARIVLDEIEPVDDGEPDQAAAAAVEATAAAGDDFERVVAHVRGSPVPLGARDVAASLGLLVAAVRRYLAKATQSGRLVRLSRSLYIGPSTLPEGVMSAAALDLDVLVSGFRLTDLEASAWRVMKEQPPMPAEWFREPTPEELPPDSGGVHYRNGRVYGWVAQAGVPHEVHGRKVQIDKLGKIDTSYFLRAKFPLDDGAEVAVGTITMNVGHHRDGFQCETAACQFDNSGTVAGIVTVGMNRRGMWFSGAAAPWLSSWDLSVFRACQPSYHMTQGGDGAWQLKAVLSVPVPGHPSRLAAASHLAATAVVERSNLALTAAAATLPTDRSSAPPEPEPQHTPTPDTAPAGVASEVTAALLTPEFLDTFSAALQQRKTERAAQQRAEIEQLTAQVHGTAA